MDMLGRAQRVVMQGEVGVGEPQDGQPESVGRHDLLAEASRHLDVALEIVAHVEMGVAGQRGAAGAERARAVQHRAEMIGIEKIGRAGRDVRIGDLAARLGQPLGHGGHVQGAAGHAAHGLAEGRGADIVHGDPARLDQRHLVAFEAVPAGKAARRDRGGRDARDRGKDRAMIVGVAMAGPQARQGRRMGLADPLGAEAVAYDQDRPTGPGSVHQTMIDHARPRGIVIRAGCLPAQRCGRSWPPRRARTGGTVRPSSRPALRPARARRSGPRRR